MTEPHWLTDEEIKVLSPQGGILEGLDTYNPVYHYDTGWYYWDETWSQCFGPFETKDDTKKSLKEYGDSL